MNYKNFHYYLFNQITEQIEHLKQLQRRAEEICIEPNENEILVHSKIKFTHNKKER